ncbi:alpha/beta fold hydrolase [Isachenkonia alkalipeptolytica]|uniref:Alpha/beta hydrolase n=1 Tax=Isachenkonia alkalipeptolytica TaxID=2565777 RepID=A0AA43XLT3_9CLOT|nr:alpha/beta hydrolase [Isachenkonia alkalipeptolytica]NBG88686.1 alpha/beta hydrolase [Isachenkonia alkalipeptolytica]
MAYMKIKDINFYYEVKGNPDGEKTIVFLNGVMASTNSWKSYVKIFEALNFKIILHDFKGQLLSDKPKGPYRFEDHAKETRELLKALGVKKAHFIGTSYGGEVGMKFGVLFPEMVESLTLINSVSEMDETLRLFVEGWKESAGRKDGEAFFWDLAPTIYHSSFLEKDPEGLKKRARGMKNLDEEFFQGQIALYDTFLQDIYMTDELYLIKAPTLIIGGEKDLLKSIKFQEILAKNIPHAEYVVIPDCGHVTIFEKEEELKTLLLGFVMKHIRTIC